MKSKVLKQYFEAQKVAGKMQIGEIKMKDSPFTAIYDGKWRYIAWSLSDYPNPGTHRITHKGKELHANKVIICDADNPIKGSEDYCLVTGKLLFV